MQGIVRDIQDALKRLEEFEGSSSLSDFKRQKQEGVRLMLKGAIARLKKASVGNKEAYSLAARMDEASPSELRSLLDEFASFVVDSPRSESIHRPKLPGDISVEVHADIDELETCLKAKAYRSAIILCGRILETALHRKYFEATGQDLLEKAPGMGLGNLIARLNNKGVKLDPGLPNQIHLINQVRIVSVHKKKDLFVPSEAQTRAIVLYTLDVVDRLFN